MLCPDRELDLMAYGRVVAEAIRKGLAGGNLCHPHYPEGTTLHFKNRDCRITLMREPDVDRAGRYTHYLGDLLGELFPNLTLHLRKAADGLYDLTLIVPLDDALLLAAAK